jgi:nucleoside-diphosphate-sugar epimerase
MNTSRLTQKVLVTGSQGYVGTELMKRLLDLRIEATGIDIGYFQNSKIDDSPERTFEKIDIRNYDSLDLRKFDCIIHLAALSNDPLGEINADLTYLINRDCAIKLAKKAKSHGVGRFIFASTQSIYGVSNAETELSEDAQKNPITAYAKSKWHAEQEILGLSSNDFTTVAVRPSTIFGWGSRIRNDIIFNNMIASGIRKSKIEVHTDGTPHRPVIHISDVVDFLILLLHKPSNIIQGQAYNLGCIGGNFTVLEVAEVASKCLGGIPILLRTEDLGDQRSYRVSFIKAKQELGYSGSKSLQYGGEEILANVKNLSEEMREKYFSETIRLNVLKRLISSGNLNSDLSWI